MHRRWQRGKPAGLADVRRRARRRQRWHLRAVRERGLIMGGGRDRPVPHRARSCDREGVGAAPQASAHMTADELDPLIHVPARLRIVATLAVLPSGDALTFSRLQDMIGLTAGNLITHLRKLVDAGSMTTEKTGNGVASRTTVELTRQGRAALETYTSALRGLLTGL